MNGTIYCHGLNGSYSSVGPAPEDALEIGRIAIRFTLPPDKTSEELQNLFRLIHGLIKGNSSPHGGFCQKSREHTKWQSRIYESERVAGVRTRRISGKPFMMIQIRVGEPNIRP